MNRALAAYLRRVVVTGVGIVSPIGLGSTRVLDNLNMGARGGRELVGEQFANSHVKIAATVPRRGDDTDVRASLLGLETFDPADWLRREDTRTIKGVPAIEYAMAAASMALDNSKLLSHEDFRSERCGVCVGTGMSPMPEIAAAHALVQEGRPRRVSPFFVPRVLTNMASGHVSMRFGLRGPSSAPSTACTTGAHAIGDAARWLQLGMADYAVAGATEAAVEPLSIAGFSQARALATPQEDSGDPASLCRPFDKSRNGFMLGEGAAVLVLETLESAEMRGAPIIAELVGYGMSSDAHHVTAPRPDGAGALASMRAACRDAAALAGSRVRVRSVNAHATGTPLGDAGELRAIQSLVNGRPARQAGGATGGSEARDGGGEGGGDVVVDPWEAQAAADSLEYLAIGEEEDAASPPAAVCSTKGATGHLLGAAGALEAAISALSVQAGWTSPTANFQVPDVEFEGVDEGGVDGIKLARGPVAHADAEGQRLGESAGEVQPRTDLWLSNSFGFGGSNATLAFSRC